ncbi:MAG: hypothetical protein ACRD3M_16115 [Thermoanaerobaculia bacterium]
MTRLAPSSRTSRPTKIASRVLLLLSCVFLPAVARALTIYRVELVGGGVVFAESAPKPSGATLVFRSAPQGILVALRRSEVARVEIIEADNKPPLDLGRATIKQVAAPRPAIPAHAAAETAGDSMPAKAPAIRHYPVGDDQPGRSVAFPASRDDLLPGNYRPFPAGRGGQSGPLPMIEEGRGVPKAGSLQEPPKAIQLPEPPASANIQVPVAPLVYSEKPHVDEIQKATPPARHASNPS